MDGWADRLRTGIEDAADSLGASRAWLDAHGVEAVDVPHVARLLRTALVAAHLAGRYDVAEESAETGVALATASAEHTRLPFDEQIAFFRSKLSLPTEAWTDIWQNEHDVAFVVAGAARDDLVSDLRAAVDQAIAEGTTLATFRREFDSIVARHGWSYKGGRQLAHRSHLRHEPAHVLRGGALPPDEGRRGPAAVLALSALRCVRAPATRTRRMGRPGAAAR